MREHHFETSPQALSIAASLIALIATFCVFHSARSNDDCSVDSRKIPSPVIDNTAIINVLRSSYGAKSSIHSIRKITTIDERTVEVRFMRRDELITGSISSPCSATLRLDGQIWKVVRTRHGCILL